MKPLEIVGVGGRWFVRRPNVWGSLTLAPDVLAACTTREAAEAALRLLSL